MESEWFMLGASTILSFIADSVEKMLLLEPSEGPAVGLAFWRPAPGELGMQKTFYIDPPAVGRLGKKTNEYIKWDSNSGRAAFHVLGVTSLS